MSNEKNITKDRTPTKPKEIEQRLLCEKPGISHFCAYRLPYM